MRPLTKIEAHLLRRFKHELSDPRSSPLEQARLLLFFPENEPGLQLNLQVPGSRTTVMFVLSYGIRPVRYRIALTQTEKTNVLCELWDRCLGPHNRLDDRSHRDRERCQLFYEVEYSDAELKKLEE